MFIGYIKNNEDKNDQKSQSLAIRSFAQKNGLQLDCLCADYSFMDIKEMIFPNIEGVVIFNISSLGDSLAQIRDNLLFCRNHNLQIYSIDDNYYFNDNNLTDDFFKGIDVAIHLRSNLISQNVKKVLKKRKNKGLKLGRPLGTSIKKRLDGKEDEIRNLLAQNVSKSEIARRFNVTRNTVFLFVKKNKLDEKDVKNV